MGFGASRAEARQVVRHNGVLVNGKRVNIPSFGLRPGDVVQLTDAARAHLRTKAALEAAESRNFPEWLEVNVKEARGVLKALPVREDLPASLNEGLVVELYSR
jgi:small subunit ribosomal protein S4